MYLPEMDADFNISAFLDFENGDGYELVADIPADYLQQSFNIGDPAPIIFWVKQTAYIVEGDAEKSKLQEIFGVSVKIHPVLQDLGGMLDDARTGKIRAQQEEWLAKEIEAAYDDVFLEPPSRTKYWISRYRVALENARQITKPPHPIDVRLRRASSEWLERFATKAELSMIGALLGEAAQGIYSIRQIADVMFAYLSHRATTLKGADLSKFAADPTIRSLFPQGLYYHYITNGWPHVVFGFSKPDFLELMKECLTRCHEKRAWKPARRMAELLFGNRDAPKEIDEITSSFIAPLAQEYSRIRKHSESNDSYQFKVAGNELLNAAGRIVELADQVNDLCCIIIGADRVDGKMMSGRFQVEDHVTDRYRFISE